MIVSARPIKIAVLGLAILSIVAVVTYGKSSQEYAQIKPVQVTKEALVHDATGNSFLDDLETNSVKVESIAEAKKMISYEVPVPASVSGHDLSGIYVENNSILYLRYAGELYIVYHKDPEGFKPNIDETLRVRPDVSEALVRNQKAIASSNQKPVLNSDQTPGNSAKTIPSATLGWHENGLHIAIYDYSGETVVKLKSIAESMR